MKGGIPAAGRAARGKAGSLVLPCSAGESQEITLPANSTVPLAVPPPPGLSSIPPRGCVTDGTAQALLGAGRCHSRGCSWPCKVLCPTVGIQGHHGFRGLERHTGAAKARTEARPAEPGHLQEEHSIPATCGNKLSIRSQTWHHPHSP